MLLESELLEDGLEIVLLLFLFLLVCDLGLALFHLVSGLLLDGFLEDSLEEVVLDLCRVVLLSQHVDLLLELLAMASLLLSATLVDLDGLIALLLHVIDLAELLLLLVHLGILFALFLVHVAHLALTDDIHSADCLGLLVDLTLLVVVVDLDDALATVCCEVELSLSDLLFSGNAWLELELLSHLLHVIYVVVFLVLQGGMTLRLIIVNFRVDGYRLIYESISVTLEVLERFLTKSLLPVNETVFDSMMVVPHLSILIVDLNQLLEIAVA